MNVFVESVAILFLPMKSEYIIAYNFEQYIVLFNAKDTFSNHATS